MTYTEFRNSQQKFQSQDGMLAFLDRGQGDVILLLHGVPTSGWLYRHIIPQLVEAGYRVIAPDMLGFGNSDSPKGYDIYSEEQHAVRILQLMNALGIDSWTHVMHDAGGLWTWELIKKQPTRIQKLVVLNTIIFEAGFKPPIRLEQGLIAKVVMWSYRNGVTTNMMLKGLFKSGLKKNNLTDQDLEGYKMPLLEGKTNGMYYFFTQTCNKLPDYSQLIKDIDVPALVLWGEGDSFLLWEPQKEQVMFHLDLQSNDVHLLDARHFIQEEQPDEISTRILNFLS